MGLDGIFEENFWDLVILLFSKPAKNFFLILIPQLLDFWPGSCMATRSETRSFQIAQLL
jgi:hypothetical protein